MSGTYEATMRNPEKTEASPPGWEEFEPGCYQPDAALRAEIERRYGDLDGLARALDAMKRSIRWSE